jgi:hypothetical protein
MRFVVMVLPVWMHSNIHAKSSFVIMTIVANHRHGHSFDGRMAVDDAMFHVKLIDLDVEPVAAKM